MITKDNQNIPILEITAENYKVPAGEERYFHVKMEVKQFNQNTGERISHPFIQKFTRVDFENGMLSTLRQQGYTIDILHNPIDWAKEQAEKEAKTKAQKAAEAKAKAEAEKEALKEEIRQEIVKEMKEKEAKKEDKKSDKKNDKAAKAEEPAPATDPAPATEPAPAEEPDLS